jgi:AraC-like DNA-binding protein
LEDDAFAKDIVASLKQVVHAYLKEPGLGLNQVAELFNTSPRTLQRKLAEAGASYSEVLEQARLEAACGMLEKPDCTVTHVSYFLGYSDPTNFARAFRRVAGVSPKEYHRQRTRRG